MVDRTRMRANRKRIKAEEQMARAKEQLEKAQRAMKDAKAVEAHRNHHLYAHGAEWYRRNLRAEHVSALTAMWSRPLPMFVAVLQASSDASPDKSVGDLLAEYVRHGDIALSLEGDRIILRREVAEYVKNCETWLACQADPHARQDWRASKITIPQVWLIERTCELLGASERPSLASCGEAHDWLAQIRANLRLNLASVAQSLGSSEAPSKVEANEDVSHGTASPIVPTAPVGSAAVELRQAGLLPLHGENDRG